MTLRPKQRFILSLLSIIISCPALADKVFLKNGEMIEGIVTQESDSNVVLDLGVGSTTISRGKVKSIEHAGDDGNDIIRNQWQKDYFLNKQNVPQGMENISEGFKKLAASRADLIRNIQAGTSADAGIIRIRNEIADLQKTMLEVTLKLRTASTNDPATYNTIVLDHNATSAMLTMKHDELEKLNKTSSNLGGQISSYLDAIASYKSEFNRKLEEYKKGKENAASTFLFEKIGEKLKGFEKECIDFNVPFTTAGKSVIVTAIANNNISGKFILDTGASMVTISQAFAGRASLSTNNTGKFEIFLADGSKKTVPSVSMDSFQIGDAKVGKLEALVVPSGPGGGMDGLVGMNFLQHFQVHLDAANGKLTLRQLKTK